jgi:hypothetical protein
LAIWVKSIDRVNLDVWCRLPQNRSNEPGVNLDKVCGLDRLVIGFRSSAKTKQTNPSLPKWQSDGLVGDGENEQTNPILPKRQSLVEYTRTGGARTNPTGSDDYSRYRANEATGPSTRSGLRERSQSGQDGRQGGRQAARRRANEAIEAEASRRRMGSRGQDCETNPTGWFLDESH